MSASPVLPLRPLTAGELLDTAAALLRSRWKQLLTIALALAAVEQVIMTTLRVATAEEVIPRAGVDGDTGLLWVWIVGGLTTELFILTLLGAPATRTAVAAVRGEDPNRLPFWTADGRTWARAAGIAAAVAAMGAVAAVMCFFPWIIIFAMFGLAVPALAADGLQPRQAFARSVRLLGRSSCRTGGIRLLAYTSWLLIRAVITCAALVSVDYVDFSTIAFEHFMVMLGVVYLVINTVAYAMLACVDAVTHIETRVRTEGLDVAVARMRAHNRPIRIDAPEAR